MKLQTITKSSALIFACIFIQTYILAQQVVIQTYDINNEEGTLVGMPYKTTQAADNLFYDSNIDGITKQEDGKEYTYYPNFPEWSLWEDDHYVYPGRAYKLIPTIDDYTYTFPPETSINTSSVALKTTSAIDSVTGVSIPYSIASYNVEVPCYHDSTFALDSYEFHKCFIDHLQNAVIPDSTYAQFPDMNLNGKYQYNLKINYDSWLFKVKAHDIIRVYSAKDSTVIGIGGVYDYPHCIGVRCDAYFMEAGDSTFFTFSYYEDPYKEYPITVLEWLDSGVYIAKQYYLGMNSRGFTAPCSCYNKDLTIISEWDCLNDSIATILLADQAANNNTITDEPIADAETNEIVPDIAVTTSNCLRIHPNPVRDVAYLTICSDTIGDVRIMLYAMGGAKLIDKKVAVEQGEQIIPLDTPFPDGAYIVRVIFVDGTKETEQITIKK